MKNQRFEMMSLLFWAILFLSGAVFLPSLRSAEETVSENQGGKPDEFLAELDVACDQAVASFVSDYDIHSSENLRTKARVETKNLIYYLNRYPDQERAKGWMEFLLLDGLKDALSPQNDDIGAVTASLNRFEHDGEGLDEDCFIRVREALKSFKNARDRERTGNPREDFAYYCQSIKDSVRTLLGNGVADPEAAEIVAMSLKNLNEFQPNSKEVQKVAALLRTRFSSPNMNIQVRDRVLFPEKDTVVTRPTKVHEIIRGTPTYGKGTVTGSVHPSFIPNGEKAEIRLTLTTAIKTNTIAYSQGVTVLSANSGSVNVTKSAYLDDALTFGPTASASNLQSSITGINTGRGPIGSKVVYDRIYQEYPYSKAESQRLMERKVVSEFETGVNNFINNGNYFNQLMKYLKSKDYQPEIHSWTTDSELGWVSALGEEGQLGPITEAPAVEPRDLMVKIHQSAFNNPFYKMLAGKRLSEQDVIDRLREIFPNVDFDAAVKKMEDTEKQAVADSSTEGEASCDRNDAYLTFYDELPLAVTFNENKIRVSARVDLFEQGEKSLPGLDIDVIYQAEKQNDRFVLVQQEIEAWPPEIERGATIPARFQVIRNQVLKRLKSSLPTEIPLNALPLRSELMKRGEKQGETEQNPDQSLTVSAETMESSVVADSSVTTVPSVSTEVSMTEESDPTTETVVTEAETMPEKEVANTPATEKNDADNSATAPIRGFLDIQDLTFDRGWFVLGAEYLPAENAETPETVTQGTMK